MGNKGQAEKLDSTRQIVVVSHKRSELLTKAEKERHMSFHKPPLGMGLRPPEITLGNPIKPVTAESKGLQLYKDSEGSALSYARQMDKKIPVPGKTVGGAATSGLAGAGAGASIGTAVSTGSAAGPYGAAAGAAVGILGYYLS